MHCFCHAFSVTMTQKQSLKIKFPNHSNDLLVAFMCVQLLNTIYLTIDSPVTTFEICYSNSLAPQTAQIFTVSFFSFLSLLLVFLSILSQAKFSKVIYLNLCPPDLLPSLITTQIFFFNNFIQLA